MALMDALNNPLFNLGMGILQGNQGPGGGIGAGLAGGLQGLQGLQQRQQQQAQQASLAEREAARLALEERRVKALEERQAFEQAQPPKQPSLPSLQQNLLSMGLEPGSPEWNQAMIQSLKGGPAVQVSVGGEKPLPYKIPANYMLKDPNDPSKGVQAIPGTEAAKKAKVGAFTEGQASAANFANMMVTSAESLDAVDPDGSIGSSISFHAKMKAGAPGLLAMTDAEKRVYQSFQAWGRAKLRDESGATISPDEMSGEFAVFFPQPGDTPGVIEQKRKARSQAEKGLIQSSQGAYGDMYLKNKEAPAAAPATDMSGLSDEDLLKMYGQ